MYYSKEPLVSIIVITYNSSKYVLETLESAKEQTYQNIELIISDDCSTDDTLQICRKWLEDNHDQFVRSEIVSTAKNTGIPANCNRGMNASQGEWIKIIAGDDVLSNNCIKFFVQFCHENPNAKIVESISQYFKGSYSEENFTHQQNNGNLPFFDINATAKDQYEILLRRNPVHAPSVFMNKNIVLEVDGFDETNRFMEDHPMWLKITKKNYKIFFLNEVTVYYRLHDSSIFASGSKNKIINEFYLKRRSADLKHIYPNLSPLERFLKQIEFYRVHSLNKVGVNKNNLFCKIIYFGSFKLSPYRILSSYKVRNIEKLISQKKKNKKCFQS